MSVKVIKALINNGKPLVSVSSYRGTNGNYFKRIGDRLLDFKSNVTYLTRSVSPDLEYLKSREELRSLNLSQYDNGVQVLNGDGFASRNFVLGLLRSKGFDEEHNVYSSDDEILLSNTLLEPITYLELGYLLTYGLPSSSRPRIGDYRPSKEIKLSIISIEDSNGNKEPELRVKQYISYTSLSKYIEDMRVSLRPIPFPMYYGFMKKFGEGYKPFGQVSRKEVLQVLGLWE